MTIEYLNELLSKDPESVIKELEVSDYDLPKWSDMVKQYDPKQHSIFDLTKYPVILNDNNTDDFLRTPLALQKLAVNRIAQAMFATPVERIYTYNKESDSERELVDLMEEVYRVNNNIDSSNIERAKMVNATCQVLTIWYIKEEPTLLKNIPAKYKLMHRNFSEMGGYKISVQLDDYGDILVVSMAYKDKKDVEYFDIFTNVPGNSTAYRFIKDGGWKIADLYPKKLEVFPIVHTYINEPVWGGDSGTALVEQLEEMESYEGLYIKNNSVPTFTMDYGDIGTGQISKGVDESSNNRRRVISVGKGGGMQDVTWTGAGESLVKRYARLRNSFFEQVQMPDISFANMINSNTSAENKELLFSDAKAKARDLGGEWEYFLFQELEIIKKFMAIIYSSYSSILPTISIRSQIKPYSIKSKTENAEYVATAGASMSLETKVRVLGEVDDVAGEVNAIIEQQNTEANQMI